MSQVVLPKKFNQISKSNTMIEEPINTLNDEQDDVNIVDITKTIIKTTNLEDNQEENDIVQPKTYELILKLQTADIQKVEIVDKTKYKLAPPTPKIINPSIINIEIKNETKEENNEFSTLICLNIDGHKQSELSIKLSTELFDYLSSKLLAIYISNEKIDNTLNYANKMENVIELNLSRFSNIPFASHFIVEDKYLDEFIGQSLELARLNQADYFITGYNSLKGPLFSSKALSRNLWYLLSHCTIPTIICKEFQQRKKKKSGGYSWLVIFDDTYVNCFKAFTVFSKLINPTLDTVHGYGIFPSFITYDNYKRNFSEFCDLHSFNDYSYESETHVKDVANLIIDKVNHGVQYYDFVVMYNNINRYMSQGESSVSERIIRRSMANICFINSI